MEPKKVIKSKTMWFNALLPVIAALPQILEGLASPEGAEAIRALIPAQWSSILLAVAVVGNIILRKVTTQPLQ